MDWKYAQLIGNVERVTIGIDLDPLRFSTWDWPRAPDSVASLRSRIRGGHTICKVEILPAAQFLTLRLVTSVATEGACIDLDGPGHAPPYLCVRLLLGMKPNEREYRRNGAIWRIIRHFIDLPYFVSMITAGIAIIWLPIRVLTEIVKGSGQWKSAIAVGSILVAIAVIIYIFFLIVNRLAFEPKDVQSN